MKTLVADECQVFQDLVVPPDCHEVQRQEMVRSFYAGCSSMLKIVFELSEIYDDEERRAAMDMVMHEVDDFAARVERGEA